MVSYTASYATLYDHIGQSAFSERLVGRLLTRFAQQQPGRACRALDLACGTGAAARRFAAAGYEVIGLDCSPAMLAQARARQDDSSSPPVRFVEADMRSLSAPASSDLSDLLVPRSFDLITCLSGSLNEVTGDDDLAAVLVGAARLLRAGGWLVFDLLSEAEYGSWEERDQVLHNGCDYVAYQRLEYDAAQWRARRRIVWFTREIELWWRSEEIHHERAWREIDLRAVLQQPALAALQVQREYLASLDAVAPADEGGRTGAAPEEGAARRVLYTLQKEP